MKRKVFSVLFVFLAIAVVSCGARAESMAYDGESKNSRLALGAPAFEMEVAAAPLEDTFTDTSTSIEATSGERIVIRNANLSLIVLDPTSAVETISSLATNKGGFVVDSNVYKVQASSGKEVPAAYMTIRVPAEELDDTLVEIKNLVEDKDLDILNESISGQDVTAEVTDLDSRLRNLQRAEEQLLDILDNATDTEDVLNVYRELTNIRGQIEVIEGQLKYYNESARLSAISIQLSSKEEAAPLTIGKWRPSVTIQRALQALIDGVLFLGKSLIWILLFIVPIVVLLGVPVFFIYKAIKKQTNKKKK